MSDFLFSSEAATVTVAHRLARETAKHNRVALDMLIEAMRPIGREIERRGKLPRQAVEPAFRALMKRLDGCPNVIHLQPGEKQPFQSGLSVNGAYNARLVVAMTDEEGSDSERNYEFATGELLMDRHGVQVRLDSADVTIWNHANSRFAWRDRKHHVEFFQDMMRTLRNACLLTHAATRHKSFRLAMPHAGGLLLGHVEVVDDPEAERELPAVVRYDRHGRGVETAERTRPNVDYRLKAVLKTYVAGESVTGTKADMLDALTRWQAEHARAIELWSEGMLFGSTPLTRDLPSEEMRRIMSSMLDATEALAFSPLWTRFAAEAGD